ncbi:MAG: hypothetical protein AB1689_11725 [Thermodesulfobacteriota bacterium]
MALYLDEIWLNTATRESTLQAYAAFRGVASSGALPPGVTLKAGPWFSNEEAKVVLVLDIADHAQTFTSFTLAIASGLIARRRLEAIVEASAVDALVDALGG